MAITNCKECGKEVSNTAPACPHCGVTSPNMTTVQRDLESSKVKFRKGALWGVATLITGLVWANSSLSEDAGFWPLVAVAMGIAQYFYYQFKVISIVRKLKKLTL